MSEVTVVSVLVNDKGQVAVESNRPRGYDKRTWLKLLAEARDAIEQMRVTTEGRR